MADDDGLGSVVDDFDADGCEAVDEDGGFLGEVEDEELGVAGAIGGENDGLEVGEEEIDDLFLVFLGAGVELFGIVAE